MGHILQSIKRRLHLGGSKSRDLTAGAQQPQAPVTAAASAPLPPPGHSPASPANWASLQQRSGQDSAETKQIQPMKSPRRRVPLGTLPAELAALEQQFASLPLHRAPSKEQLQTRLLAAGPPKQAQQNGHSIADSKQVSSKQAPRVANGINAATLSGNEASKPPAVGWRAVARGRADVKPGRGVRSVAAKSHSASEEHQQPATLPATGCRPVSASPCSSVALGPAHFKANRQAAKRLPNKADERAQSGAAASAVWQGSYTGVVMPPAVPLARQVEAAEGHTGSCQSNVRVNSSGSSSSSSSHGELDSQLDVQAAGGFAGSTPGSTTQPPGLPENLNGRRPTPPTAGLSQGAYEGRSPLLQRTPRNQLPPDLLSLRDSVARARTGRAAGTPLRTRRAASVQEEAAARGRTASGGSSEMMHPPPLSRPPATAGASLSAKAAASSLPQQPPPGELSRGTKRLAALRRQRRSEWTSDFGGSGPGCHTSQDGEDPSLPLALAPVVEDRPASAMPLSPSAGSKRSRLSIGRPATSEPAAAAASPGPNPRPAAAPEGFGGRQAGDEQLSLVPRAPGLTQAQLRQQEAWGHLAGLSLGEVLQQGPGDGQQGTAAGTAAGREDLTAQPNSCSSTGCAGSPTPPPAHEQPESQRPGQSSRQGRRMTVPHASFVESMERLAALHRARSDSEQPNGGIQWRLPPSMRRSHGSPGRRLPPLPSSQGLCGSATQVLDTRPAAGSGHLAKSRCRGSPLHGANSAAQLSGLQPQQKDAAGLEPAAPAGAQPSELPPPAHGPGMQPPQPPPQLPAPQPQPPPPQHQQQQRRPTFSGPSEQLPRLEIQRSQPQVLQYLPQYQAQPGMHAGVQQAAQHSLHAVPQTHAPLWWQQQQQYAAYMHAQRQYAAQMAAQQGQHLPQQHIQQQQRLLSQHSLPLQSGSGRRKWQTLAEAGLAGQPLHIADPGAGFAHGNNSSPWQHQLPHQHPAQGQAPHWIQHQHQHQHQHQQRHSGTYAPVFGSHAGLQRYHSGGQLLSAGHGYSAGTHHQPDGTGMAVRGHSFMQAPAAASHTSLSAVHS